MALTKQQVMQVVSRYIGVDSGYLGDFSYRTHNEFYPEYCDIHDIFPDELPGTTRERFITILGAQSAGRQAQILRGVLERFPVEGRLDARSKFKPQIEAWIAELDGEPVVASPTVEAASTSEVVRRALSDAESLLRTGGPVSAVDRIHTALHGHLKALCAAEGIRVPDGATLQKTMKELRMHHPKLTPAGARAGEVSQVLFSMAATLDALNTIRNNASAAHPNEILLGDPEALLAVNAGRTIFTYVTQKTSEPGPRLELPDATTSPWDAAPF